MITALAIFIYLLRDILLPFVFAGIVAYFCTPLVEHLSARTGSPRWLFPLATLLALFALTLLIGYLAWQPLAHEIVRVAGNLHGTIQALIAQFIGRQPFTLYGQHVVPHGLRHPCPTGCGIDSTRAAVC